MNMALRNLLFIDEHSALWQKIGSDSNTWLLFFKLYARPVRHATRYCKFVLATSQLHEFKLPSGYIFSIQYVDPLSREEFEKWKRLDEYPKIFGHNDNSVVDYTGRAPGMIAELIGMSRSYPNLSFEEVTSRFYEDSYADMRIVHSEYFKSLTAEVAKKRFCDRLYELFLGRETPQLHYLIVPIAIEAY